jgi:uncharacterized protein (TIGR04562 family)
MALSKEIAERYLFRDDIINVVLKAQSAIDGVDELGIKTMDEARGFLECYGFDLDDPIERAELFGHYQEALSFIRQYFLYPSNVEGLRLEIPRKLLELSDPVQLLIFSGQRESDGSATELARWACAIIKVMHTISHLDRDIRTNYFSDVQTQILDRFYRHIHNENGRLFIGKDAKDPLLVDLVAFQTKPKKSRDSMILKMLHKPENVAEDIFDRVGLRFVTKNRLDALRLLKYLRDRHIMMPANLKPSRTRNTLIPVDGFLTALKEVTVQLAEDRLTVAQADAHLNEVCSQSVVEDLRENPHSSKEYASLQFTCRQLIKIKNPIFNELKELRSLSETILPQQVRDIVFRIDLKDVQKEVRFFYPFEVQIYDELSHNRNLEGASAHSLYKKNQIMAAMRRVMRGFT